MSILSVDSLSLSSIEEPDQYEKLHCTNCNIQLIKEDEIKYITTARIFGKEDTLNIYRAMSVTFEHGRKLYSDFLQPKDEDKLYMCINCASVLTNIYNEYRKFMMLTATDSYMKIYLKESILWTENKLNDASQHSKTRGTFNVRFEKIKTEEGNSTNPLVNEENVDDINVDTEDTDLENDSILPGEPSADSISETDANVIGDDASSQKQDDRSNVPLEKFPQLSIVRLATEDINAAKNYKKFLEKRQKYSTSALGTDKAFVKSTTCSICSRIFIEPRLTKMHYESAHKKITKTISCQLCDKKFANKWFCSLHSKTAHFGIKLTFICPVCEVHFKSEALLNHHRATVHQDRLEPFCCNHCQQGFKEIEELRKHLTERHPNSNEAKAAAENIRLTLLKKQQLDKTPIQTIKATCDICKMIFIDELTRDKHIRYDHEQRTACVFCEKSFTSISECRNHEIIHESHKCHLCEKSFGRRHRLRMHLEKVHSQANSFVCEVCGKFYSQLYSLSQHYSWHKVVSAPPQFECKICKKAFALRHSYTTHQRSVHGDGRPKFQCQRCPRFFYARCNLDHHQENAHNMESEFKCDRCDKGFSKYSSLAKHKSFHTKIAFKPKSIKDGDSNFDVMACYNEKERAFFCSICGRRVNRKDHFIDHFKRIHATTKVVAPVNKIFKCRTCNQIFATKEKLQEHSKLKGHRNMSAITHVSLKDDFMEAYECEECGKVIKGIKGFKRHKQIHDPNYDTKLRKIVVQTSDQEK